MELNDVQNEIRKYMVHFSTEISSETALGKTDLKRVAENVLLSILSEVYDYPNLRNLNVERQDNPSIDLADDSLKIAIQVTATTNSNKIVDTLEKYVKYKYYDRYERLIIYILTKKQRSYKSTRFEKIIDGKFSFNPKNDIIDFEDVLRKTKDFSIDKARKVLSILEKNFSQRRENTENVSLTGNDEGIVVNEFDYYDPNKPTDFRTGIVIYNNGPIPFSNVEIELKGTKWRKFAPDGEVFLIENIGVLMDNSRFSEWANSHSHSINPYSSEVIYFYQVESGILLALLNNRREVFQQNHFFDKGVAESIIEVTFEVRGGIGNNFYRKTYQQSLLYLTKKIRSVPPEINSSIRSKGLQICDG